MIFSRRPLLSQSSEMHCLSKTIKIRVCARSEVQILYNFISQREGMSPKRTPYLVQGHLVHLSVWFFGPISPSYSVRPARWRLETVRSALFSLGQRWLRCTGIFLTTHGFQIFWRVASSMASGSSLKKKKRLFWSKFLALSSVLSGSGGQHFHMLSDIVVQRARWCVQPHGKHAWFLSNFIFCTFSLS